ncbi:MAG: RNA polymerase sigma factor [Bacteroidales bacterium]|nr:RNA polymerase sigma factor [Bacteroidales bacterium]
MTVAEYNKSVEDHSDGVYRFILKNIKNDDKARDVVQDTYEKLWLKVEEVSAEKVKSYLFTAAYHTMIDMIRKEKRVTGYEAEKHDKPSHSEHYTGLSQILEEAVAKLPADQRSVIMLRDYEGYSYEEIAGITGLTESQVKVYIFRGRMFLKNYIGSIEAVI